MNEENKTFADIAAEASPRPWRVNGHSIEASDNRLFVQNEKTDSGVVAYLPSAPKSRFNKDQRAYWDEITDANAKLICECVNHYEEYKAFHLKIYDSWQAALRQRDKMREALERIAKTADAYGTTKDGDGYVCDPQLMDNFVFMVRAALDEDHPSPTSPAPNAMAEELAVTRREVERLNMRLAQQNRIVGNLRSALTKIRERCIIYNNDLAEEIDAICGNAIDIPVPCDGGDAVAPEKEGTQQ